MGRKPLAIEDDFAQVDPFPDSVPCGDLILLVSRKVPAASLDERLWNAQITVESGV